MSAEGWYRDPFGVHEDRWFSVGTPTPLVRDAGVEAQDPPPEPEWTGDLVPVVEAEADDGSDLRRADSTDPQPENALDLIEGSGAIGGTD